jgi:DNA-binding NtrC family response regulator
MRRKVLLALHDPVQASRLTDVLAGPNLELQSSTSVAKALRVLSSGTVNLVFCQEHLPDGTYRDVLRHLGLAGQTALVVCAEFYDKQAYVEAMSLGAFDYVTFPYHRRDVEWIIANAVRKAAAPPAAVGQQQSAAA